MKNYRKYSVILSSLLVFVLLFSSCKDFLDPVQEVNITEDNLYDDWYEYRSVSMGLYGLQQDLVEQIVILGELRGDLLQVTENADVDMVEIYNFNISDENKYASPTNFFKLISASNNFISVLQNNHPEVLEPNSPVTNYDRLYGEALCMRAWAYFNAVRIYGKVPFIHESITTIDEINNYINSSGTYIDSVDIVYALDGYNNDTIYNNSISLEKQFFDQELVIDFFTNELENKVKAVGVNHAIENNDQTWEVTTWNPYAMDALLGHMYLTAGDLAKAVQHFEKIMYLNSDDYRYQLDESFGNNRWSNIYSNIDPKEHIYTMWFNKANFQQHDLQRIFENRSPHEYMLKPTRQAVMLWESMWDNYVMSVNNAQPWRTELVFKGLPGDFFRGYGSSYAYSRNEENLENMSVFQMLWLKSEGDFRTAEVIMQDADTVVWKYSIDKNVFDQDANFIVYRAAGVHLWCAEAYTYWVFLQNQIPRPFTSNAVNIVNDGSNYGASSSREQMGVRGRVGFGGNTDGIKIGNIIYEHHPITNEVVNYLDYTGNFFKKQLYLEEQIIQERARELAFEGERFYDLMRVAKRRGDPSYLAEKVSKKYPPGKREEMYNLLLNEENWYINVFE